LIHSNETIVLRLLQTCDCEGAEDRHLTAAWVGRSTSHTRLRHHILRGHPGRTRRHGVIETQVGQIETLDGWMTNQEQVYLTWKLQQCC